jgi:hypothetical protein
MAMTRRTKKSSSGFRADHDHGVHAFVFGPDGKLYFNMGNEGKQLKQSRWIARD